MRPRRGTAYAAPRARRRAGGTALQSPSARRRQSPLRSLALTWGAAATLSFLFLCSVSAYPGLLHLALGDRKLGLRQGWKDYARQVLRDVRAGWINSLCAGPVPAGSDIPTVTLFADGEGFQRLNHEILLWGLGDLEERSTAPAFLLGPDGRLWPADLSLRGTNQWHHQHWKPSLRVRLKGRHLVAGARDQVLVAPEDATALRNQLSQDLAARLGLPNTGDEPVRVFLNGAYKGVYSRQRRLDESLLIRARRPPGPFVRLESMMDRPFLRQEKSFAVAANWEVQGTDDPAAAQRALQPVLDLCFDPPSPQRFSRMNQLVDADAMADYLVVLAHSGTIHVEHHNVCFLLDSISGKWVPVPLDLNGFGMRQRPDELLPIVLFRNALFYAWIQDPRNLERFVNRLDDALRGPASAGATESRIRSEWQRIRPQALADVHTSDMAFRTGAGSRGLFPVTDLDQEMERIVAFVRARDASMRDQLNGDRLWILRQGADRFTLLVQGYAGVQAARRDGARFAPMQTALAAATKVTLFPTIEQLRPEAFQQDINELVRLGLPAWSVYHLPGQPGDYAFVHRLSGMPLTPAPLNGPAPEPDRVGYPLERLPPADTEDVVLGPGDVNIRGRRWFTEGRAVRVLPDTRLHFTHGAALLISGPLSMEGTAEAPIVVDRAGASPFGVIALVGPGASGSRLRHVRIAGGSSSTIQNLRTDGMLSVHDAADVRLEDVTLTDAPVLLSVARARVEVIRCTFARGALQQVLGELTVRESGFADASLDLSMARMHMADCSTTTGLAVVAAGNSQADLGAVAAPDAATLRIRACEQSVVTLDAGRTGQVEALEEDGNWRWGGAGRVVVRPHRASPR